MTKNYLVIYIVLCLWQTETSCLQETFVLNIFFVCWFIFRNGSRPSVVVRHRMLPLHRPKEFPAVREGKRHRGPQPLFWNWLLVWLDLLRDVRCSRGETLSCYLCPKSLLLVWTHPARMSSQSSKVLAKKELSYVPIIGWMWFFLEIVFCKRKWEEDRKTVVKALHKLHDYPENFWVRPNILTKLRSRLLEVHFVMVWFSQ